MSRKPFEEKGLLNIPRTGAKSIGVSTFSTANFVEGPKERKMGDLELAVREIERMLEVVTEERGRKRIQEN